jgi:uncharacterized protein involved in exopolysaccharide biosynthesis
MRQYLDTALGYRWVIIVVLALVWGAGVAAAYIEYSTTFEAEATVWTHRGLLRLEADGRLVISPESAPPEDPDVAMHMTPSAEQAELLRQLLQTRSFVRDVLARASLPVPSSPRDEREFLDEVEKRFKVEVLGTNLFRLSYRARDPHSGPAVVLAALARSRELSVQARTATTEAATNSYKSELTLAQSHALDAQRALDGFDQAHRPPLSPSDEYRQSQLRLALADANRHVADLQARIDRAAVMADVVQTAQSLDFRIVDEPVEDVRPSGGLRPAALIAGSALAGGLALASLLVVAGTLLASRVGHEADIARIASATLFATVPEVARRQDWAGRDLRTALAEIAFAPRAPEPTSGLE